MMARFGVFLSNLVLGCGRPALYNGVRRAMGRGAKYLLSLLGGLVGLVILAVAGAAIYVSVKWDSPVMRPVVSLVAPKDEASVTRGRYIYTLTANCWGCHGGQGGLTPDEPQSGGREFDTTRIGPGFGFYYASNLTPDKDTGIGAWTDGELVRAIREGVNRKNEVIFPVMAYQFYHGLSDADALAIVAYMRSLPPVRNRVPSRRLSFPAKALITFGMLKPEPPVTTVGEAPREEATAAYGRYLAWHASGCAECHSPRSPRDGRLDPTRPFAGGLFPFPEENFETTGSNLTPDPATGIGNWTEQQFIKAMRAGTRPDGRVLMTFMPWPLYSHWSDEELTAVWMYLRSLPPQAHQVPVGHLRAAATGAPGLPRGQALFGVYCLMCHGREGRGSSLFGVVLRDIVAGADSDSLVELVLHGAGNNNSPMPAYDKTLARNQVSDIVSYLKQAAGH